MARFGKNSVLLALLLALSLSGACRAAEGETTLPAMSGVKEILLQYSRISDEKISTECGVANGEIDAALLKSLKSFGAPVFSTVEASPPKSDVYRIEIQPEIMTAKNPARECTSWISITAQAYKTLAIPPVEAKRSVIVVYWRGGLMVSSGKNTHTQAIKEAFDRLAEPFAIQFKNDQPPVL